MASRVESKDQVLPVVIIGAGLSGIMTAVELNRCLGIKATIYERANEVGGSWRDNIYPGCSCDIPSHWYSWSKEPNPNWSKKYPVQKEIFEYWKGIARKHDLYPQINFGHNLISAVWNDRDRLYTCVFQRTNTFGLSWGTYSEQVVVECRVLISCIGGFSKPKETLAQVQGIDLFSGEMFHSSRWNPDCVLAGKRVAVIGTGCSGSQIVPAIAQDPAVKVTSFSRTPNWYVPFDQEDISDLWIKIYTLLPFMMWVTRVWIAAVAHIGHFVWYTKKFDHAGFSNSWKLGIAGSKTRRFVQKASENYMKSVAPKKYHDMLIPKYPFGCKRIIRDAGFLACLHRSNVNLTTEPITRISENGIYTLGEGEEKEKFHPVDVIVLATGFDVSRCGISWNVQGTSGITLKEHWDSQGGPQGYLGTVAAGFPNYFMCLGPNVSTGTASVLFSIESQIEYIVKMIGPFAFGRVESIECKDIVEADYNLDLVTALSGTVWTECSSYFVLPTGKNIVNYPFSLLSFWWSTRKVKWSDYIVIGKDGRNISSQELESIPQRPASSVVISVLMLVVLILHVLYWVI